MLAQINFFSSGEEAVPYCLIPCPGVIRAGEQWPGMWMWEVVGRMGSGLVGLHLKTTLFWAVVGYFWVLTHCGRGSLSKVNKTLI
jgi:hypothetical protein